MLCLARGSRARLREASGDGQMGDGVKEGSCLRRWLAGLRRQPHQTQTEQGVASPSTIAVPVGVTLRLTCGPRVACCRLILFLDGGGVRAAPRRQIWRPDLSTDFHGLAVHVPFETTGTGARTDAASAVAAWQESSFPRHPGCGWLPRCRRHAPIRSTTPTNPKSPLLPWLGF